MIMTMVVIATLSSSSLVAEAAAAATASSRQHAPQSKSLERYHAGLSHIAAGPSEYDQAIAELNAAIAAAPRFRPARLALVAVLRRKAVAIQAQSHAATHAASSSIDSSDGGAGDGNAADGGGTDPTRQARAKPASDALSSSSSRRTSPDHETINLDGAPMSMSELDVRIDRANALAEQTLRDMISLDSTDAQARYLLAGHLMLVSSLESRGASAHLSHDDDNDDNDEDPSVNSKSPGESGHKNQKNAKSLTRSTALRLSEAKTLLESAVAIQPSHADALYNLAVIVWTEGEREATLRPLAFSSQAAHPNPRYQEAEAYCQAAIRAIEVMEVAAEDGGHRIWQHPHVAAELLLGHIAMTSNDAARGADRESYTVDGAEVSTDSTTRRAIRHFETAIKDFAAVQQLAWPDRLSKNKPKMSDSRQRQPKNSSQRRKRSRKSDMERDLAEELNDEEEDLLTNHDHSDSAFLHHDDNHDNDGSEKYVVETLRETHRDLQATAHLPMHLFWGGQLADLRAEAHLWLGKTLAQSDISPSAVLFHTESAVADAIERETLLQAGGRSWTRLDQLPTRPSLRHRMLEQHLLQSLQLEALLPYPFAMDPIDVAFVAARVLHHTAATPQQAIPHYLYVLSLDPDLVLALAGLANAYQLVGELDKAAQSCERASALAPEDALLANDCALILAANRQFDLAEAYYKRAIQSAPDLLEPRSNLRALYSFLGRTDDALALFQSPAEGGGAAGGKDDVASSPRDLTEQQQHRSKMATAQIAVERAMLHVANQDPGAAEAALQEAVAILPSMLSARVKLATLLVASNASRLEEALYHILQALDTAKQVWHWALFASNRDEQESASSDDGLGAKQQQQQQQQQQSRRRRRKSRSASADAEQPQLQEAATHIPPSATPPPSPSPVTASELAILYFHAGMILDLSGHTAEALEMFNQATFHSPGFSRAHMRASVLLSRHIQEVQVQAQELNEPLDSDTITHLQSLAAQASVRSRIAQRPRWFDWYEGSLLQQDAVFVSDSPVAGKGLFAKRDLPAGTLLGYYNGPLTWEFTRVEWMYTGLRPSADSSLRYVLKSDRHDMTVMPIQTVTLDEPDGGTRGATASTRQKQHSRQPRTRQVVDAPVNLVHFMNEPPPDKQLNSVLEYAHLDRRVLSDIFPRAVAEQMAESLSLPKSALASLSEIDDTFTNSATRDKLFHSQDIRRIALESLAHVGGEMDDVAFLKTRQPVKAGEELFWCYGMAYSRDYAVSGDCLGSPR
ncbi:hypothetical protein CAOG_04513, partial [Capsaspora owczarzaki ATCC 30864]